MSSKTLPFMQVVFSAPLVVAPFVQGCDQSCVDPIKTMRTGINTGVKEFGVTFSGLDMHHNSSYTNSSLLTSNSQCLPQTSECCTCEDTGKPGKWNAEKTECLCQCCCDPVAAPPHRCKVLSLKSLDNTCKCDKCPDGSLRQFWADIQCPCTCKDGKQREMQPDGRCDCSCTCEDGSRDEVDYNGNCPCECECKNCESSRLGPAGCKCPNDVCPVCETGALPQWVNCQCRCPEPECGIPPNCVHGRTGNNCDQPECSPCRGCHGNGVCVGVHRSCDSVCQCSPQWEGTCCETRRPRQAFGDPHIETLDGKWFDYFGIGQFWDCKSQLNDFGVQVRYFYYAQTSFTGAVALKAADSVVTISTPSNATQDDLPYVRVNGKLLPTERATKLILHDQVIMDIQPNSQIEGEDHAVLLLAFEYKSGVTLTVDVRFSPVMGRQYLNVQYTLTKDFKYHTSGLCGYMDDNVDNDLMGPDGKIYNNTDQFVLSWSIPTWSTNISGTEGSWSWDETNFHQDDVVDLSYTDPTYRPSYSISGFTAFQIKTATDICSSLGVEGSVMDGCIFDVVITNDTSFAEQETFKTGCPKQCSGKGRCISATHTCACLPGWSGDDCSIGECGSCYFGHCVAGFCQCEVGWDGPQCNVQATCFNVDNCTDSEHGVCERIDQCQCQEGFTGISCSEIATCSNVNNCSEHGTCVDHDVCKCDLGWGGGWCDIFSCEVLDFCSAHGRCVAYDVCLCDKGWKSPSCSIPDCLSLNHCSGNGECVAPNNCSCIQGYQGDSCNIRVQCPELENCNNNGLCIAVEERNNITYFTCRCLAGFNGITCNKAECPLVNDCSGHGTCIEPNVCKCQLGFDGPDCNQFSCESLDRCSGHGECTAFDQCVCEHGWLSLDCSEADCKSVSHCSSQGVCIAPDNCECFDGYQGDDCSNEADPNLAVPVFDKDEYVVNISETLLTPQHLVTVHATDADSGKNGEIRYSIDPAGLPLNINSYLAIDSVSGYINLLQPISSVLTNNGSLYITITAQDKGAPPAMGTTQLTLNIYEVNDHCPVVHYPAFNQPIYLSSKTLLNTTVCKIYATDADRGMHGELEYKLNNQLEVQFLKLNKEDGALYITDADLPIGEYPITITVMDKSTIDPCAIQTTFLLIIIQDQFIPTTTTTTSTTLRAPVFTISSHKRLIYKDQAVFHRTTKRQPMYTTLVTSSVVPSTTTTTSFNIPVILQQDNTALITVSVMLSFIIVVAVIIIILLVIKLQKVNNENGRRQKHMFEVQELSSET